MAAPDDAVVVMAAHCGRRHRPTPGAEVADGPGRVTPVLLTLAEAAAHLDPPVAVRTLRALVRVAQLQHVDTKAAPRRHARRYDSADLDRLHAAWCRGEISTTRAGPTRP